MKTQAIAAAMLLGLAFPLHAQTPGPGGPAASGMPLSTPMFRQMAASSDAFEIESSRLALQQSRNPRVRAFADQMVRDHTMTTQALMGSGGAGVGAGAATGAVVGGAVAGPAGAIVGAGVGATSGAAAAPGAMPAMDPRHAEMLNQLAAARGTQFDRLYAQMQLAAHDEAVALYRSYAQAGTDPNHRAFAEQVLPHLEQHREMASRLVSQTGRSRGR